MTGEIALSLEETNKIREQLGLKPIVLKNEDDTLNVNNSIRSQTSNEGNTTKVSRTIHKIENQFIDESRASQIRKRLIQSQKQSHAILDNDQKTNDGWLNSVGSQNMKKRQVQIRLEYGNEEEDDDDIPMLKVSHNIKDLKTGRDIIMTLKESEIKDGSNESDGNDDMLEDSELTNFEETSKNIKLRDMNKDRRRKKLNLNVSSKEIEQQEKGHPENFENQVLLIGAQTKLMSEEKQEMEVSNDGKIKVNFDSDDEESEGGDFKSIKIKKRKRRDKNVSNKVRKTNVPLEIKKVNLIDEDENWDDENDSLFPIGIKNKTIMKSNVKSPEELANEIRKEVLENETRAKEISKLRSRGTTNIIIDETSSFLDTLNTTLIPVQDEIINEEIFEINDNTIKVNKTSEVVVNNVDYKIEEEMTSAVVDFSGGLASTLQFLQDQNVLPKKEDAVEKTTNNNTEILELKKRIEVRRVKDDIESKLNDDSNPLSKRDKEQLKVFEKEEIQNKVKGIQDEILKDYNPEINLVYKDEKGNVLNTKEAYKKLSQKFHGTKSNKKTQAKFNARIQQRKRANDNSFNSKFFENE